MIVHPKPLGASRRLDAACGEADSREQLAAVLETFRAELDAMPEGQSKQVCRETYGKHFNRVTGKAT